MKTIIIYSGGLDSTVLLFKLRAEGHEVRALGIDYGQRHRKELDAAKLICGKIAVPYHVADLSALRALLGGSSQTDDSVPVPHGHYAAETMKQTVVPNRNMLMLSVAIAWAISTKSDSVAYAAHGGDHAIYPDCRQEFRDADMEAFKIGNWDSELVTVTTPYLELNKFDILEDGQRSCDILGLDFNEVYKRTNTSYKPIKLLIYDNLGFQYEEWFSDYKSAASVERIEAFIKLGRPDPVAYADETGPVTWEVAKTHVEQVLAEHNS
jgi:7-cyano-7-deazaguanine synthase